MLCGAVCPGTLPIPLLSPDPRQPPPEHPSRVVLAGLREPRWPASGRSRVLCGAVCPGTLPISVFFFDVVCQIFDICALKRFWCLVGALKRFGGWQIRRALKDLGVGWVGGEGVGRAAAF